MGNNIDKDIEILEQARSNILRGNDIESATLILEKAIMDNVIFEGGRVNILKIATRQVLNFIEEYKTKGYLDVVREKVKLFEELKDTKKELIIKDKTIEKIKQYAIGIDDKELLLILKNNEIDELYNKCKNEGLINE